MTNMHHLLELFGCGRECAVAEHVGDLVDCGDLSWSLDEVHRLIPSAAVGGVADTETIDRNSVETEAVSSYICVAVVVAIEGKIPVAVMNTYQHRILLQGVRTLTSYRSRYRE